MRDPANIGAFKLTLGYPGGRRSTMLHYAVVFFVIALIAAVLGFRGVAGLSAEIGYIFAVLAVIFLVVALLTGHSPPTISP
jgi:uncharacterized membrane protein YtjA (UPF0391 family)